MKAPSKPILTIPHAFAGLRSSNKLKHNLFKKLYVFGNKAEDLKNTVEYIIKRNK